MTLPAKKGPSRDRILEALRRRPGMNLSQLRKAVGLSWTTTKYHLGRLRVQGHVEVHRRGHRDVQCFPVGVPAKYRPWLATLRDESAVQVLRILKGREAGVAELARRLGWSQSATRRRLERMHGEGLLTKRGMLRPRYARPRDMPAWVEPEQDDEGASGPMDPDVSMAPREKAEGPKR